MARPRRDIRQTWLLRSVAAAALVGALAYVPFHLYKRSGLEKLIELRGDLAILQASNQRLQVELDELTRKAQRLRDDPREIEKVARHELGWVRPGDIVVDVGGAP